MTESSAGALNQPLRCQPLLKPKVWGGRGLEVVLGKLLPPGEPVGESWEVADVPEGVSSIADGPLAGASLREVMVRFGTALFPGWAIEQFPLLVKFIDAQDDISIQVHPDAEVCRRLFPTERSKNETWLVLHTEPGAAVLHGVRPGVSFEEIRERVAEGTVMDVMRRTPVQPGDAIHLPAGTLHAMLRGVMLLEVQEPSDSTFRVFDHDRPGLDGRPRPLHIEQALESLRLDSSAPARLQPEVRPHRWGERELLIDIAPYRVERLTLRRAMCWRRQARAAVVVVVVEGTIAAQAGASTMVLSRGETAIVPPSVGRMQIEPAGSSQLVIVTPCPPAHSRWARA
ncbi:MAG: type I phosphomannose isomerase catalytic subunit [Armatimonadota bacterium]